MPEYFKVDSSKITLREYWNISRSYKAVLAWGLARLGEPLPSGAAFRQPESVQEMEIPESQVTDAAKSKLLPLLQQSQASGFHSPRYYLHQSLRGDISTYFISMLHHSGKFSLRLMYTRAGTPEKPIENVLAVLLSELNDGTFFFTSDHREKFKVPPGILNNRLIGATPMQLIESHQARLEEFATRNPTKTVSSIHELDDVWNRYEKYSTDHQLRRGLYVRLSPEELEGQQPSAGTTQTPEAVQHADILFELKQLQNKKPGWGGAIWLFVISLLLFAGAGSRQWSWKYLLILVPVLFVHELGHYLAMRAFDYRNLRMFFIPFFGAAVTGRHYNVAGWKKVIVSFMGPAPGIVLGVIIGGAGLFLHQPALLKVAVVALILNGINLLPVLPLDGGWIFHTMFFSRHPMLDAVFRILAAFALMAGGIFSKDKILMYLGIPMLIGVPPAYRLSRVTRTLRERGVSAAAPDEQTVPTETAVVIIDELKKKTQKGQTNKSVAQQTLQVFESLNARPPGWLATGGLLCAYVATLGMAAVFAGVFIIGQRGGISGLVTNAIGTPKRAVACDAVRRHQGNPTAAAPFTPITIVATFADATKAGKTFDGLTNRLPASTSASLLGDSIFLRLPSDQPDLRKQWFTELENQTKTIFVESTNAPAMFSVSCQFPTEQQAEQTETDVQDYFTANYTGALIPPWYPEDDRNQAQRAAHRLARKTFVKIQAAQRGESVYKDSKMLELQKKIREANRQGDQAEVAALEKQTDELSAKLRKAEIEKLRDGHDGAVDPEMITLFGSWSPAHETNETSSAALQAMMQRMGQLAARDGELSPAKQFSARTGFTTRQRRTLQVRWVTFAEISAGAPAVIEWLCAQGATDCKYDVAHDTLVEQGDNLLDEDNN